MRAVIRATVLACLALLGAGAVPAAADVQVSFLQGEQTVQVARPGATVDDAVRALVAGPTAAERTQEITTTVSAATVVRAVSVNGTVATVDLSERFASGKKADVLSARIAQL